MNAGYRMEFLSPQLALFPAKVTVFQSVPSNDFSSLRLPGRGRGGEVRALPRRRRLMPHPSLCTPSRPPSADTEEEERFVTHPFSDGNPPERAGVRNASLTLAAKAASEGFAASGARSNL